MIGSKEPAFDPSRKYLCVYDFDSPFYAAVSILQESYLEIKHKKSGQTREFKNITEFKGRCKPDKETGLVKGGWLYDINKDQMKKGKEPYYLYDFVVETKIRIVQEDKVAKAFLNRDIEKFLSLPWCGELKLVLGNKTSTNFRNAVAFSKPYKNSRPSKPIRYHEIRDWFEEKIKKIGKANSKRVSIIYQDDVEADDICAMFGWWSWNRQEKKKKNSNQEVIGDEDTFQEVISIHIDKDLNQFPGLHFNYAKDVNEDDFLSSIPRFISEREAALSFWTQVIKGDSVDSITGLPGKGEAFCYKYLTPCKTEKEMAVVVLKAYKEFYSEGNKPFKDKEGHTHSWMDMCGEAYSLLRLLEKKGKPYITLEEHLERLGIDVQKDV